MRNYEGDKTEGLSDQVSGFSKFFGVYIGTRLVSGVFMKLVVNGLLLYGLYWLVTGGK